MLAVAAASQGHIPLHILIPLVAIVLAMFARAVIKFVIALIIVVVAFVIVDANLTFFHVLRLLIP
jgi:hypothetical protein